MEYKGEKIKFEDTNIALLGSELETKIRLASAEQEDAWKGVAQVPGLEIWRIEKFRVVPWPKEEYGNFFSGDSYIVLYTYIKKNTEALHWNAHMWVGKNTTMDEAGTAAYKIVELDTLFKREMVLFRESQGMESDTFLKYFPRVSIMDGGVETGFKKIPIEHYKPRLFHIRKSKKGNTVMEIPLSSESLNTGDVFILDAGLKLFKWVGSKANSFEKFNSASICKSIIEERSGKPVVIDLEENTDNDEFWSILGGKRDIRDGNNVTDENSEIKEKSMYKLTDQDGDLHLEKVDFRKDSLSTNDIFFVDVIFSLFIWIGNQSSLNEKKHSLEFALRYLKKHNRSVCLPLCVIPEGKETKGFLETFRI